MPRGSRSGAAALLLTLTAPTAAAAQLREVGLKAGAGTSDLDVEFTLGGTTDLESRGSLTGGALARVGMTDLLSIQAEVLLVSKGTSPGPALPGQRTLYVEMPILLRADPPDAAERPVFPFIVGGIAVAAVARCELDYRTPPMGGESDCDGGGPLGDFFRIRGWDLGAAIGGGLAVAAGPGDLLLEARYTAGIRNVLERDDGAAARNRVAALYVAYAVPLAR